MVSYVILSLKMKPMQGTRHQIRDFQLSERGLATLIRIIPVVWWPIRSDKITIMDNGRGGPQGFLEE